MDWLTFTASVIDSLAWPAAAVAIVFALRRSLNKLLPDLNKLKYKDLELEFGKQVAEAKMEIERTVKPPQLPESEMAQVGRDAAYFEALADISPRAAVLEAWLPFEAAASAIAQDIGVQQRRDIG